MARSNRSVQIKPVLSRIKNIVFAVVLFLLFTAVIITLVSRVNGKTPSLFGYSMYRISSDSMTPSLSVGDIILSHECDPETLRDGDIITYEGTVGEFSGRDVTHRVVRAPYRENGEVYLVTKGDDNPAEDTPIRSTQVKGVFVAKLGIMRFLYSLFLTPWGYILLMGMILFAFSGEIMKMLRFLSHRLRKNSK